LRPFAYRAPASVGDAVSLLAENGPRARPLAGGTDLLVQLRAGRFDLDLVVDVKHIPELNAVSYSPAAGLTVGAAVSCATLCENPDVQAHYPALIDSAGLIGGTAIQARASLGGNLCNAAPSGDSIPAIIVLNATCTIAGPQGWREVPVASFCTGPGRTMLGAGEMLVSIHFPSPLAHTGACYLRFIPRHEMDIAVAGAGAWLRLSRDHSRITEARIALAAVAPTPLAVVQAGEFLAGKAPDNEAFAAAARFAEEAARPISDVRGSDAQRRHLVSVLVKRALSGALRRAEGEASNA
jgi:CO/xanthine dehydrogenase FAD-binding subunit